MLEPANYAENLVLVAHGRDKQPFSQHPNRTAEPMRKCWSLETPVVAGSRKRHHHAISLCRRETSQLRTMCRRSLAAPRPHPPGYGTPDGVRCCPWRWPSRRQRAPLPDRLPFTLCKPPWRAKSCCSLPPSLPPPNGRRAPCPLCVGRPRRGGVASPPPYEAFAHERRPRHRRRDDGVVSASAAPPVSGGALPAFAGDGPQVALWARPSVH